MDGIVCVLRSSLEEKARERACCSVARANLGFFYEYPPSP